MDLGLHKVAVAQPKNHQTLLIWHMFYHLFRLNCPRLSRCPTQTPPSFHPSTAFVRRVARLRRTSTADTRRRTSARRIGLWVPGPSGARRAEPPCGSSRGGNGGIDEMTYSAAAAAILPGVHQHHQLQLELARKVHDTPETRRRMTRSKDR